VLSKIPTPRLAFLVASTLVASVLVVGLMMLTTLEGPAPAHLLGGTHYGPAKDATAAAVAANDA
jgi:hypothetical protein